MGEHYQAGQLQEPVQIIRKTRVADGAGGYTETEATLPSPSTFHYAFSRPLRGQEREANGQVQSELGRLFVLWAPVEVRQTDVILYNSRRYQVTAAHDPGLSKFREVEAVAGGLT